MSGDIADTMSSDMGSLNLSETSTPETNTKTTMSRVAKLPVELQLEILDHLIEITRPTSVNRGAPNGERLPRKPVALLRAAETCSLWRQYLMPHICHNLFLTQRSIRVLDILTTAQRNHVQYIWLTIELPKDKVFPRESRANSTALQANTTLQANTVHDGTRKRWVIEAALGELFANLAWWPRRRADGTLTRLTLEVSLHCSEVASRDGSVSETHFDSSPFLRPGEPLERTRPRWRRKCWPWVRPDVAHLESMSIAMRRVAWRPMYDFDQVGVVSRFVIRRQSRHLMAPSTMERILHALPVLDSMLYEPWRFNLGHRLMDRDHDIAGMLQSLPRRLKHLVLFEDFNRYHLREEEERVSSQPNLAYRVPWITVAVAQLCQLETLSASYLIDAHMFFTGLSTIGEGKPWRALRSLHLTSALLLAGGRDRDDGGQGDRRVNALLRHAATTVESSLPKLETLVLWYGTAGAACAFRFHIGEDGGREAVPRARIGWRGTWRLVMEPDTIEAWAELARARTGGRSLVVEAQEMLVDKALYSHGPAIRTLGLAEQVIHPVSLMQIVGEGSEDHRGDIVCPTCGSVFDSDDSDGSDGSNQSNVCAACGVVHNHSVSPTNNEDEKRNWSGVFPTLLLIGAAVSVLSLGGSLVYYLSR